MIQGAARIGAAAPGRVVLLHGFAGTSARRAFIIAAATTRSARRVVVIVVLIPVGTANCDKSGERGNCDYFFHFDMSFLACPPTSHEHLLPQ